MAERTMKGSKTMQELTYKGKPLIRKGNMLYYGEPNAKYIITMKILNTKNIRQLNVANKVSIELHINDPALKAREKVLKKAEREGLYRALDIGTIWLEDALNS